MAELTPRYLPKPAQVRGDPAQILPKTGVVVIPRKELTRKHHLTTTISARTDHSLERSSTVPWMKRVELGIPLRDGNSGNTVYLVGDTVRRDAKPWSATIDALLLHLESIGYSGSPRALGYDELGRQVLSFVPGRVAPDPSDLTETEIRHVGRLIREFHDASASFSSPPEAVWNVAIAANAEELICHHDLAPWNLVRGENTMVFIDWDGAGPGSRLWDLTYAAHGFTPLSPRSELDSRTLKLRLRALVDGYELSEFQRTIFISLLAPRIYSMYQLLHLGHSGNVEPWASLWSKEHGTIWLEDHDFTKNHLRWWFEALE